MDVVEEMPVEDVTTVDVPTVVDASTEEGNKELEASASTPPLEAATEEVSAVDESRDYCDDVLGKMLFPTSRRTSMPESKIHEILDVYIKEYPAYLTAKQERQTIEFHEQVGRAVNSKGSIVTDLLKNLGREYRKLWTKSGGMLPVGGFRLRGSPHLFKKYEEYHNIYNKISGGIIGKTLPRGTPVRLSSTQNPTPASTPRIKKLKPSKKPKINSFEEQSINFPPIAQVPPIAVLSDRYCQEYLEVLREQNHVLTDIAKELRLMRMGYFTEHELSLDA
ncbi:uncharacterized protein [Diadema setosum]|uniref:uncharacterized protein n=1 Tax=Diadema setosum TaxID=31175 RepID=UPI003B3AD2C0